MSKILDYALTGVGKSLLFVANVFRHLWSVNPWRRTGTGWWARMALPDGHGKMRNWPCFCKSGKKFKRCCGATVQQRAYWGRQQAAHAARQLDLQRLRNLTTMHV